jgi:hypothetical protein
MAHTGPRDARKGGRSWADLGEGPGCARGSPPSDSTSPTSDTLTECVGFVVFGPSHVPEAHSGWVYGCVTATPTPDTTEDVFVLVTGLWRGNECRPANGLLIRAGRWGMPAGATSPDAPDRHRDVPSAPWGPRQRCRLMGRSGEFAVSDPPGIRLVRRRGAVVISTQDGEMQADCMAQVTGPPWRHWGWEGLVVSVRAGVMAWFKDAL